MKMNSSAASEGGWICFPKKDARNRGVFYGDNPLNFTTPIFYTQLSLPALLTSLLRLILTPLGETAYISQMMVGIALGPSLLGKYHSFSRTVFPLTSLYVSETFALFACMLSVFLVAVKTDIGIVRQSGKKAVVIGLCAFFVPLILSTSFGLILGHTMNLEPDLRKSLIFVAAFQSFSCFNVITCLLEDLKLLNSELGRLALSSSLISGICTWIFATMAFMARQSSLTKQVSFPWMALSLGGMLIIIIFVLRPIFPWMIRNTAKGKELRETYFFCIVVMMLGCAFFGEVVGLRFILGPMILGLAVPDGPPIGSALVDKLESYVSSILLPGYFLSSCSRINLRKINVKTTKIVGILDLCSLLGKVIGTMLPSLYYGIPAADSFVLGLVLCAQGITDMLVLQDGMLLSLIDEQLFTILSISTVLITGTITPIVKLLYKPSKGYMYSRRRTIQHAPPNTELRLLACIYHHDITPLLISLLEVSNPTAESPVALYVVHLIQLLGRTAPLLIMHGQGKRNSVLPYHSDNIIRAFQIYERCTRGEVLVNAFTAIAPYATMHDEICSLAFEKRVSMVIIPFHKQWNLHDTNHSANSVRSVNLKVLNNAPCSVGILVDKGTLSGRTNRMERRPSYSVLVIFIEGPDDREALAYARRMAEHQNVSLTVVRFLQSDKKTKRSALKKLDDDIINHFKMNSMDKMHHIYKEVLVSDSVEVIRVIQSLQNLCDLILVGRRHSSYLPFLVGLSMWNEFPELGSLGDMLASSGSNWEVSLLVVQQQTCEGKDMPIFKRLVKDSTAAGDIPQDTASEANSPPPMSTRYI